MTATTCQACDGTGTMPGEPQNDIPPHVCQTCKGVGCTHPDHLDAVYNAVRCFGCQVHSGRSATSSGDA